MTPGFWHDLGGVALMVGLISIPFGYWRDSTRRFSVAWFLAVHGPVPLVIGLRLAFDLGADFTTIPVLLGAYSLGQFLGGRWHRRRGLQKR